MEGKPVAVSRTAILGYADRFSVARGQRIDFKVSCDGPATFGVEIVRLICADPTPGGPGVRYDAVDDLGGNKFPGRVQAIHPGSHVNVPASPALARLRGFGLAAMVWPTTPAKGRQAVMGWWREDTGTGFLLELDATGALALRLGDGSGEPLCLSTGVPLPEREWAFVAAAYEAETGMATVDQWLLRPRAGRRTDGEVRAMVERSWRKPGEVFFRLAAWMDGVDGLAGGHFNGKIDRPRLVSEALSADDLHALAVTAAPDPARPDVIAAWDFSRDIRGTRVHDTAANRLDGETVNLPARAVTGFNWDGTVLDWRLDPSQYGAIHFHDDDLHDCGWATDASWTVPEDATSGCYAARLHAAHLQADQESWIAFFVRPRPGRPTAPVAYLAATATYLAYANTHVKVDSQNSENLFESVLTLSEEELYLHIHRELGYSTYDTHADGSGVFHASRLRPLLTVRPGLYTFNYVNDSHITGWLEGLGQPYDVITDEDLHAEGRTLLDGYRVLITGSHPEYYSTPMWDAVDAFQRGGGRHMALGGNGFYWRIAWHDSLPGVLEMRRGIAGVRTWEGEPGEDNLSFNGDPGGLWRSHGRAPQRLIGVGFAATLFDRSVAYRRTAASHDGRVGFMFEGIGEDEPIGGFGFRGGGAAGMEIDRFDVVLGSPPEALVVATSESPGLGGLLSQEEFITTTRALDGLQHGKVRADMVFFETPGGGAVWATGSIAWATSLLWEGGDADKNNVARITQNVLNRFLDPTPFDGGE